MDLMANLANLYFSSARFSYNATRVLGFTVCLLHRHHRHYFAFETSTSDITASVRASFVEMQRPPEVRNLDFFAAAACFLGYVLAALPAFEDCL